MPVKSGEDQKARFAEAARALECDESEARFNTALGKIVRHKPVPEKPPKKAEKPKLSPQKKQPAK